MKDALLFFLWIIFALKKDEIIGECCIMISFITYALCEIYI
jgi:hypothetical protein